MKNFRIPQFILASFVLLWTACDKSDKLNPIPSTLISNISAFQTEDRILNQVNGLYASFKGSGFWGSHYIYYSEARAGNFVATHLNPTRGGLSYMMTVDPGTTDVSTVWRQGYQIINGCNVFIEGMEAEGKAVVGDQLGGQYIAEAKFLRGLVYYYLLQMYAEPYQKDNGASPGLPLRLVGNRGLGDYNLKRSTVAEVYAQILTDFNDAQAGLPLQHGTALANTTRAHRNTVLAAKSNVYLAMGKYDDVISVSTDLVPQQAPYVASSGVAHAMSANPVAVFRPPYTTTESILSMPFSSSDVPGTSLGNAYLPDGTNAVGLGTSGGGDFYLLENGVIASADWKETDKRRQLIFVTASGPNTGRAWSAKYVQGSPYTDYVPVIRYAQVLLNLAEALAQKNGVDNRALALLNAVRQRSDETTTLTASTKEQLIELILHERNIEFLGEGIRNLDLVQRLQPIPAKAPVGATPIPSVQPGTPNYIWPIPTSESLYNADL